MNARPSRIMHRRTAYPPPTASVSDPSTPTRFVLLGAAITVACLAALTSPASARPGAHGQGEWDELTGEELYGAACANCHGSDGRGAAQTQVGFELPLPDFSDCSFATREPNADWASVVREGGPARAFQEHMPAFGSALSHEEIDRVLRHVRTFCTETGWPRGELNFPRPFYTSKAFPEDEVVLTTTVGLEDKTSVTNALSYEQRFGTSSNFEITVPFIVREHEMEGDTSWVAGIGDIALGAKSAVFHSYESGSILSLAGEMILPLGDDERGMGKGVTVFEPFLAYGQALPLDGFSQLQLGSEIPLANSATPAVFWRLALGLSGTEGLGGRTWSPMVEVLGDYELEEGKVPDWDVVPGMQVTLSTRQHVRLGVAARLPMTRVDERDKFLRTYLLWDWFDGGLFEGW